MLYILYSGKVHAGCVFVAGSLLPRTRTSGSLQSVKRSACIQRLDLGLLLQSHPKELRIAIPAMIKFKTATATGLVIQLMIK